MDPYKVLGVSYDADEETIKKAYRSLVKKYHPDRYVNTPMAETASEKMKEINEAYDMITNKKAGNSYSTGNTYRSQGYSNAGGYDSTYDNYNYTIISFDTVRRLIQKHRYVEAELMLNKLEHNAEWHYLMGLVYLHKGWSNEGFEYIRKAVNMDPDNIEYKNAQNMYNGKNDEYTKSVVNPCSSACLSLCSSLCISWYCCKCGCC